MPTPARPSPDTDFAGLRLRHDAIFGCDQASLDQMAHGGLAGLPTGMETWRAWRRRGRPCRRRPQCSAKAPGSRHAAASNNVNGDSALNRITSSPGFPGRCAALYRRPSDFAHDIVCAKRPLPKTIRPAGIDINTGNRHRCLKTQPPPRGWPRTGSDFTNFYPVTAGLAARCEAFFFCGSA